ncbi:short-chain fatty acyl-CoA regulator family protein [Phreatobacter sp.]|uniref:helix-turn-helix domain-containing protein n=1 Tax=Phreatobacter sp. TaxID=1966341 RepID=UPI0022CB76E8|nr:short-chain fatty acyl-CoA regulator family protein [Phreatobacter sp.]MCZ8316127.1 short-chain fatty acyl-CoA regulator family protein [Phreatobacter sp.]
MSRKVFVGPSLRRLREETRLTQTAFAQRLGLSVSYLNQIENNQRPVTAGVLVALGQTFGVDLATFATDDTDRLVTDLREASADPLLTDTAPSLQELKRVASDSPAFARAFLRLHQTARRFGERLQAAGDTPILPPSGEETAGALLPYEEVRDYFHYVDNYVDDLDRAAEDLAERLGLAAASDRLQVLAGYLAARHGLNVDANANLGDDVLERYEAGPNVIALDGALDSSTRAFLLANRIARLEQPDTLATIVSGAGFRSRAAGDIARVALANYFAGALLLPYRRFLAAAKDTRHDLDRLGRIFGASLEQVCHRLSTLQRPGQRGIPFYFVKVDRAGNVIKRHSATRFQFARFGGACPLWNVHEAFEQAGRTFVQVAEMPDGIRYLSLARAVTKGSAHWRAPVRRYAFGLGCEISYAGEIVYSEGIDLKADAHVAKIGVSCRICERANCHQRAVPPIDREIRVPGDRRKVVPFDLS